MEQLDTLLTRRRLRTCRKLVRYACLEWRANGRLDGGLVDTLARVVSTPSGSLRWSLWFYY